MKNIRLRDVGFFALALFFLWACVLFRLHRYGQSHPDAEKQYLIDHQCYAAARKIDGLGRKYTVYKCQSGDEDEIDLYEMQKGPGEK